MTDIVERLRLLGRHLLSLDDKSPEGLMQMEAADEIERLRQRLKKNPTQSISPAPGQAIREESDGTPR